MPDNQELVDTLVEIADDLLSNLDGGAVTSRFLRDTLNHSQELDQIFILDRFYIFLANFYAETRGVVITGQFDAEQARLEIAAVADEFEGDGNYGDIIQMMATLDGEFFLNRFARMAEYDVDFGEGTVEADDSNFSFDLDAFGGAGGSFSGAHASFGS